MLPDASSMMTTNIIVARSKSGMCDGSKFTTVLMLSLMTKIKF